jgi:DNA polymerase-1
MATSSGQMTNAVYGFTAMLVRLLEAWRPSACAAAFDLAEPTFRHEAAVTYKANRAETPDPLREQLGIVRRLLELLGIAIVEQSGFEADDVLATLATRARDRGLAALVVSGDRDCFQLVEDPYIRVVYTRRGVTDYLIMDEAAVRERTGVPPSAYVDLAALRGDPSDNLPGVPGVGEKTAAKLIQQYGSLEELYSHLGELRPRLAEALAQHREQVFENARLMRLVRDVPLAVSLEDLRLGSWDREGTRELFGLLEFRSLWPKLAPIRDELGGVEVVEAKPQASVKADVAASNEQARKLLGGLEQAASLVLEAVWPGRPGRELPLALGILGRLGDRGEGGLLVGLEGSLLGEEEVCGLLSRVLGRGGWCSSQSKELLRALWPMGVSLGEPGLDLAVASYLVDPTASAFELADLAERYLGESFAPADGQLPFGGIAAPAAEAADKAALAERLVEPVQAELARAGQERLYREVEGPLISVLARMEIVGIKVDSDYLRGLVAELQAEADEIQRRVQEAVGFSFNLNSTPQLREVLYGKLGLRPQRRTKTGYSTDAATLSKLAEELAGDPERSEIREIIEDILRYREVEKLRSTFGVGLLAEIAPDGRIHASFNQTVARTGRLSSDQPNLHNIPTRSEDGRRFRRAFIPEDGWQFLVADYDQIELRVIAHLTSDPGLIEAFSHGRDVHAATAAAVFGVPENQVTPAMRSKAKMVSYGLAYGMEAYGLSMRLGIDIGEAEEILNAYFRAFPSVRAYMERTVAEVRERGYTETILGRRRPVPEVRSPNSRVRQAAERQAMNAGIQGSAADIFKLGLVRLDKALVGRRSRVVLQVHDEVVVEVYPGEEEEVAQAVQAALEGALELKVPLKVHVGWGASWADAKA